MVSVSTYASSQRLNVCHWQHQIILLKLVIVVSASEHSSIHPTQSIYHRVSFTYGVLGTTVIIVNIFEPLVLSHVQILLSE